ncbi:MAG: hypothetical protein ACI97A_002291 [Planctomycetota bacterium]|jgi:hypothetical protein
MVKSLIAHEDPKCSSNGALMEESTRMGRLLIRVAISSCLALVVIGCKSTDDYLYDLNTLDPTPISGREFLKEKAIIFDAGQLAHEAFAGLASAEDMKFWQIITSLSHACNFLGTARDRSLLQADAAMLIGVLLSRTPIPPITDTLNDHTDNAQLIVDNLDQLLKARKNLQVPGLIEALGSADEVQKIEAQTKLRELTGQDLPPEADQWTAWYETQEETMLAEFVEQSKAPLQFLGSVRWLRGSEVRPILKIFSYWLNQYARPELEEYYVPCLLNIARQAAVLSLNEAMLRNREGAVRADVSEAMTSILDPAFGDSLISQLPLERNPYAAAKMIRALAAYPSRKTIEQIITSMAKEDPLVSQNAADVLETMTGVNFQLDREAWEIWWLETGVKLWP